MLLKAKESQTKAKLGSLRSTLAIYYADTEGLVPQKGHPYNATSFGAFFIWLPTSLVPKYIDEIPTINIPRHHEGLPSGIVSEINGGYLETFTWSYNGDLPGFVIPDTTYHMNLLYSTTTIRLSINCLHPDPSGRIWSTW